MGSQVQQIRFMNTLARFVSASIAISRGLRSSKAKNSSGTLKSDLEMSQDFFRVCQNVFSRFSKNIFGNDFPKIQNFDLKF